MAIITVWPDPVRLWVDRVAIVSSLGLSSTRDASSTMQQSFQLASPVFTITPKITCSLPTRKDLGGGGSRYVDLGGQCCGPRDHHSWSIHGPRKRWSRLVFTARFNGGDNKLSAASWFRGYACICQRALQWTCIVHKFWESDFVFKWYTRRWMTSLI
jgi:hypothetical protein